jgi:hypothetical protein
MYVQRQCFTYYALLKKGKKKFLKTRCYLMRCKVLQRWRCNSRSQGCLLGRHVRDHLLKSSYIYLGINVKFVGRSRDCARNGLEIQVSKIASYLPLTFESACQSFK